MGSVSEMRLSRAEIEKRSKLYSAEHMARLKREISENMRRERALKAEIRSSPFTAHNRSVVVDSVLDTTSKVSNSNRPN